MQSESRQYEVRKKKGGQLATKRETAEHHFRGSLGYQFDHREQQCSANRVSVSLPEQPSEQCQCTDTSNV